MANDNIRLRLQALFGEQASFSAQCEDRYYRVQAVFPLSYERRQMPR
jgi:hypothetical protein